MENTLAVGSNIKIVVVGDELVGKTTIINNFNNAEVPLARTSTIFQSIQSLLDIGGVKTPIEIWDTTGKKQYDMMIKSIYEDANIVLILFSVAHNETYKSAIEQWHKEISAVNRKALKVFVGNKTDLRNQGIAGKGVQQREARLKIQQELGCKYLQCCAETGEGVRYVFEFSVRSYVGQAVVARTDKRKIKDNQCCALM